MTTATRPRTAEQIIADHCPPGCVFAANLEPGVGVPTTAEEAVAWEAGVLRVGGKKKTNGNNGTMGGRRVRPDELVAVPGHVRNLTGHRPEFAEGGFLIYKREG